MGNFSNHDSELLICNNNVKFILRIGLLCKYQQFIQSIDVNIFFNQ